jgi:integral membrane protein
MSTLKKFRIIALLEGISFLLLLGIAMPLKYIYGLPVAVKIAGMAHGIFFIAFVFLLMQIRSEKNWSARKTALAFLSSLLPFGTFVLDAKVLKKES